MPADKSEKTKPSDYMRARHPELFSDSLKSVEPALSKSLLDFHLENLTKNKEEIRFEHFCRHLAQKEICPNLSPQTGPTGGGDSKVDAENYPVATNIAFTWYVGDPQKSSNERWAFAFSAKKAWKPKVAEDVQKIAETNRGYALIYFMTNQPVRDKDRAKVEESLQEQWNVKVRILDRNWISTKVIENKRWDVVYQTLDIDFPYKENLVLGPFDAERKMALEELDKEIEEAPSKNISNYQLIEDCLTSAILARGLSLPRTEIDGRFLRAERYATEKGTNNQVFRILYQRAWTAYWWFDDLNELERIYENLEKITLDSGSIWDLEKLGNLLMAAKFSPAKSRTQNHGKIWADRTSSLIKALEKHAKDKDKPTASLLAKTQMLLIKLPEALKNKDALGITVLQLKEILKAGRKRLDFPFEAIVQIIEELSGMVENPSLDNLFEYLIEQSSKRNGEVSEGTLRLTRGMQKLLAGKKYDAIEQFAKATTLLAKNENKIDFLKALTGTAMCFESAGLFWAARGNLLIAIDRAFYGFEATGKLIPQTLLMLTQMIWIELQLGRIICVISWIELLNTALNVLVLTKSGKEDFMHEFECIDLTLATLILRTKIEDLSGLERFHGVLNKFGLMRSRAALIFCLGHEEVLKSELKEEENLKELFNSWIEMTLEADLPLHVEWHKTKSINLKSYLMGCEVSISMPNNASTIILSEAIFAFLESLLSTAITFKEHFSFRPLLMLKIKENPDLNKPFVHQVVEDDCGETEIHIEFNNHLLETSHEKKLHKFFFSLAIDVIQELQVPFSKDSIEKLLVADKALDRSAICASSCKALKSIFNSPRYQVNDWLDESIEANLPLVRTGPWNDGVLPVNKDVMEANAIHSNYEKFGIDGLRHRDLRVKSAINLPLWNRAGWHSTGYVFFPNEGKILLIPVFKDRDSGRKIFRGWLKKFGSIDEEEHLNLSIITGINKDYPMAYRVVITTSENDVFEKTEGTKPTACIYRMNDMNPQDSKNLDLFQAVFDKTQKYYLTFGHSSSQDKAFDFEEELAIEKRKISIVPAWTIGPTNILCGALGMISNPIIPDGTVEVPFYQSRKALLSVAQK